MIFGYDAGRDFCLSSWLPSGLFLLAAYVMTPRKESQAPQANMQNLEEMLKQQIAFVQAQNMLRSIQLFLSSYAITRNENN